jgi:hypothetical protein
MARGDGAEQLSGDASPGLFGRDDSISFSNLIRVSGCLDGLRRSKLT